MQDIVAGSFIIFVLLLYVTVAFVFMIAAIRKWVWGPLQGKFSPRRPDRNFRRIKTTHREESPS
jgi:hypothetical protein